MAKDSKGLQAWYFIARYVTAVLFKILFRYQVIGKEKVPQTGRLLVCANHSTMADPIFLGSAVPKRQMKFVAKAELFKNKLLGGFLSSLGAFPIARGTGGAEGIQTAMRYLEEGHAVCLFPEGTRSKTGELLPPQNGAAMLAARTECAILPIAITAKGGKRPKVFRKMIIKIGDPIPYEALGFSGTVGASQYREATRVIFDKIRVLREESLQLMDKGGKAK